MARTFGTAWLAGQNDRGNRLRSRAEHVARLPAILADADGTKFADALDLRSSSMADSELRELIHFIAKAAPKTSPPRP